MEINNGINIGSIFPLNNSQQKPITEIVNFECFSFEKLSDINDISGCLKLLNGNYAYGGLVFLFKSKKNLELLNKRFYVSGFKAYILKEDSNNITILEQFNKKDFVNVMDNSATQRVKDDDSLMQFGFVWFFDKPNNLKNAYKMYIETYFAIDNIRKSYLTSKEIDAFVDNKFSTENMDISVENRNVYNCRL